MPTLTIKATEMKDAQVSHISLVERGANRIPFKVVKQEKPMRALDIDLARVFTKKKEALKAEIVAVVTLKEDGTFDAVSDAFVAAGFAVAKSEELADKSVVFAQTDEDKMGTPEEHTIVRLSEQAALVVKAFRPYNMDFNIGDEGTSFADVCKAQGFYPGLGTMVDVLRSSVLQVAEKSENPDDAAKAVQKMFAEAGSYAASVVSQLPAKAFKLEQIEIAKAEETPVAKSEPTVEELAATQAAADAAAAATAEAAAKGEKAPAMAPKGMKPEDYAKLDDAGKTAAHAEAKKAEGEELGAPAAGVTIEQVQTTVATALEAFATKMGELIAPVAKSVKDMDASLSGIEGRVSEAEKIAKASAEAVNGTTVLGSEVSDHGAASHNGVARKSSVEIDTAYAPRRRAGRA